MTTLAREVVSSAGMRASSGAAAHGVGDLAVPEPKSRVRMLLSVLEQGVVSAYAFVLMFLAARMLPDAQFVIVSNVVLAAGLANTLVSAAVLQPLLLSLRDGERLPLRPALSAGLGLSAVFALLAVAVGRAAGLVGALVPLAALVVTLVVTTEIVRRSAMRRADWPGLLAAATTLLLAVVALVAIMAVRSSAGFLLAVAASYVAALALLVGRVRRRAEERSGAPVTASPVVGLRRSTAAWLVLSAVAYWFYTGGVLLWLAAVLPAEQVVSLRSAQAWFNGFLIISVALDNFIVASSSKGLPRTTARALVAIVALAVMHAVVGLYVLESMTRGRADVVLVAMLACGYAAFTIARVELALLKRRGGVSVAALVQASPALLLGATLGAGLVLDAVTPRVFAGAWTGAALVTMLLTRLYRPHADSPAPADR